MVNKLKDMGYVSFQPYGYIQLTEKGGQKGRFLLERHDILHRLFCLINHSENELETVELIEHYINEDTIYNIRAFLDSLPG